MPKVVDAAVLRREIRTAARRVFAERGVRGTGLAHVAEAAGMGRSSLYHYYPDKQSLLTEMISELLEQERRVFRACLQAEGSPISRLEALARACAALFPEWAAFGRVIIDLRLEDAKQLKSYFRDLRRDMARVISEGQQDGSIAPEPEAKVQAAVLIGAIDGLLLQYFIDARALPSPASLADSLAELTRRMVTT